MYKDIFINLDEKYKQYVKVTQCGVVRFDAGTPHSIQGLCTDGLSACLGIVVKNEDDTRFSLIHTDLAFDVNGLLQECQWVGQPCTITIVKGRFYQQKDRSPAKDFYEATLPRLEKALKNSNLNVRIDINRYRQAADAIAISRSGGIRVFPVSNTMNRIGQAAPDIELRHTQNMIIAKAFSLQNKHHGFDIQYDGQQWTPIQKLSDDIIEFVKNYKQNPLFALKDAMGIDLADEITELKNQAQHYNQQALKAYREQRYASAICAFELVKNASVFSQPQAIADTYFNLGSSYLKHQQPEQSIPLLQQAVAIRTEVFGREAEKTKQARQRLEECLLAQKESLGVIETTLNKLAK